MNTYLKALFDKYNISEKNKHEILQIFIILPDNKKQKLLNNFATLAMRLQKIEEEVEVERSLLIWEAAIRIRDAIFNKEKEEGKI